MKTAIFSRLPILLFTALPFAPPALSAGDRAPAQGKNLASTLRPFVDRHTLAGAVVLVADKDRILDLEAVGFADIAAGTSMPLDGLFWIASQSKPITAAGLMLLVDEGKVKLDDPVEKYLPEFKELWVRVEQDKDHQFLSSTVRVHFREVAARGRGPGRGRGGGKVPVRWYQ